MINAFAMSSISMETVHPYRDEIARLLLHSDVQ